MVPRLDSAPLTRRSFVTRLAAATGAAAGSGALAGVIASAIGSPAADAAPVTAIEILQTASSLEQVAVSTYEAALNLNTIKGTYPSVIKFVQTTLTQHTQHAAQFQARTAALNGPVQSSADPAYQAVISQALPSVTSVTGMLQLALQLETTARDTYLSAIPRLPDAQSRTILASVMGVEAEHVASLRLLIGLLNLHVPALVTLPVLVDRLPASFGSIATPDGPFPVPSQARPLTEGARR